MAVTLAVVYSKSPVDVGAADVASNQRGTRWIRTHVDDRETVTEQPRGENVAPALVVMNVDAVVDHRT